MRIFQLINLLRFSIFYISAQTYYTEIYELFRNVMILKLHCVFPVNFQDSALQYRRNEQQTVFLGFPLSLVLFKGEYTALTLFDRDREGKGAIEGRMSAD